MSEAEEREAGIMRLRQALQQLSQIGLSSRLEVTEYSLNKRSRLRFNEYLKWRMQCLATCSPGAWGLLAGSGMHASMSRRTVRGERPASQLT